MVRLHRRQAPVIRYPPPIALEKTFLGEIFGPVKVFTMCDYFFYLPVCAAIRYEGVIKCAEPLQKRDLVTFGKSRRGGSLMRRTWESKIVTVVAWGTISCKQ